MKLPRRHDFVDGSAMSAWQATIVFLTGSVGCWALGTVMEARLNYEEAAEIVNFFPFHWRVEEYLLLHPESVYAYVSSFFSTLVAFAIGVCFSWNRYHPSKRQNDDPVATEKPSALWLLLAPATAVAILVFPLTGFDDQISDYASLFSGSGLVSVGWTRANCFYFLPYFTIPPVAD